MSENVVIDPAQVQAYAQVMVQETKRAAEGVGDELLVGPSQQDFCACGELRSAIPWLDAELTEVHDQVVNALNRIVGAGVDAVNRAVQLRQEEAVGTTVGTPGSSVVTDPSAVTVSPQVGSVGTMTNAQLSNYLVNQQMGTDLFIKTMNMADTTNPLFLPEGVDPMGFDNEGDMHYTGPSGIGDSTDPLSLDLD